MARKHLQISLCLLIFASLSSIPISSAGSSSQSEIEASREDLTSPLYSPLVASQWQFSLPEAVLQKSFIFQGSTGRIKQVLMRLLKGETVHIGVLGGSVSTGKGASNPATTGYFALVADWLVKAFPKSEVICRNGAISGSPSMYMERFLGSRLDPGVDLVLLEYAVNNRLDLTTINYEDVRSVERILRTVMEGSQHSNTQQMKPAAVMMVNMWRGTRYNGTVYKYLHYTEYLGDHYNLLAQYYSVPTVAVRNGLYHAYRRHDGMFKDLKDAFPPNEVHSLTHPNDLGHKWMADMIVYAFYVALAQLQQNGITEGDFEDINLPQPPPLIAGSELEINLASWHDEAMKATVVKADGWRWGREAAKGGFATYTPGSKITIQVDSTVPSNMLQHHPGLKQAPVTVHLGLLKSYEHMGQVRVTCVEGCSCTPVEFDTNDPDDRTSQAYPYKVLVTKSSVCKLQLECLEASTNLRKEHKLIIRGVAVTATVKMSVSGMPLVFPFP